MSNVAELRRRLFAIGASLLVVGLIVPSPEVARAVTAQGAVVTPEILTISPSSGPLTGGDLVTITGTDLNAVPFDPNQGESPVYFGTTNGAGGVAGRIVSQTATSMVVQVPRGTATGAVNVTLVTNAVRVTRDAGYTYLAPAFTSITPAASSTAGGVSVTIKGVGFGYARFGAGNSYISSVTVGGTSFTSFTRTNETTITGTVPASSVGSKNVVVTVVPHIGDPIVISSTGAFSYVLAPTAPTITAISPANGPVAGGNTVQISGTNFVGSNTNPATVTIGGQPLTDLLVVPGSNNKTITGTVPARATPGKVDVVVQTSDGRATMVNGYEYAPAPTIASVAPPGGPLEGGVRITITGTNFGEVGSPTVTVGGVAAICVTRISSTIVTAVVPAGTAGAADVVVNLTNGGGSATATGAYTYAPATQNPTVSAISPVEGTAAGGTTLTFTGTDLGNASTTILVNGSCASEVSGTSGTSLTAKTPSGTMGWATIKIATTTGTLTIPASAQQFRYVDITSIVPSSDQTTGGATVVITGTGFGSTTAPTVTIGGAAATVGSFSDTSITVTAPPGTTGRRDVVVTPASGGLLTKVAGFTYVAPSVLDVTPNSGLLAGGNTVTITGTGFGSSGTPAVTFGGVAATGVVLLSSSQLTAVVPARVTVGSVSVSVTPAVGTGSGTLENGYTYAPLVRTPLIDNVSPDRGPNSGGTSITVLGANFRGSNNTPATVTLRGTAVSGLTVNAGGTSLTFTTPALTPGYAELRITTNEGSAIYYYAFLSVGPPVVVSGCSAVSPNGTVYYTGSNSVTVTGTGFGATGTPTVTVNGTSATVTASSDTAVTFTIPNVPLGSLNISITPTTGGPALTLNGCITLKRLLTITAVATPVSIDFGVASATFSFTTSGLQSGHAVSSVTYYFTGVAPTSYSRSTVVPTNAGLYQVAPDAAVFSPGSAAANYDIVYVPTSYTIVGTPATVTANSQTITYGETPAAFTSTATGLRGSDALGSVTYTFTNSGYDSTTIPTDAGTYTITPTVNSLSPGNVGNYSFTAITGTFTINRKPVTVTADAKTKKYGSDDPDLTWTTSPSATLSGDLTRISGEDVASYEIQQGTVTDENNPNYLITYVSDNLEITPETVTVTAEAKSKTYGNNDPTLTYTKSPDVTLAGSLSRDPGENVGTYSITQGTITSTPNYTIVFVGALLTIDKREIEITADDKTAVFGASLPSNSVGLSSGTLRSGDAITGATYAYGPTTPPSDVGSYSITPSAAVISAGRESNYDITYVAGSLEITKKPVTVTPDSGQNKMFGDSDPTLTYTLSDSSISGTVSGKLSYSGGSGVGNHPFTIGDLTSSSPNHALTLASGVTFEITKKPVTVTPDSGQSKSYGDSNPTYDYTTSPSVSLTGDLGRVAGEDVASGPYAFTLGNLVASNPNYELTLTPGITFAITPVTVTVTAAAKSKGYGDSDPTLTYTKSPNVTLSGTLSRDPGENVGTYSITQGSVTSTTNYTVSFEGALLTITTKEITIKADNQTITYGDALPTNGVTVTSGALKSGETITSATYTYGTDPTPSDAGVYTITPSAAVISGGGAGNYDITYADGTLIIQQRPVKVTPDSNQSKVFGAVDPVLTFTLPEEDAASDAAIRADMSGALSYGGGPNVGNYPINIGSLAASNYTMVLTTGVTFEITKKDITVLALAQTKVYGEDDPPLDYEVVDEDIALSGALDRDDGEDVATYDITQGTLTNANNTNYNITFTPSTLEITKANVTVTPDSGQKKLVGDLDPATLTFTADPDVPLTGALTRVDGENVDDYEILQGTLVSGSNYDITFVPLVTFAITKRTITVTADDQDSVFGDVGLPTNSFTVTAGEFLAGDQFVGASANYGPVASPTDAGTYTITPYSAVITVGAQSSTDNYQFEYEDGTLTIDPLPATITAADASSQFGQDPPEFTSSAVGLLTPDELDSTEYSFSGNGYGPSLTPPTAPGTYVMTPAETVTFSTGKTSNYEFTFEPADYTITGSEVGSLVPIQGSYLGGTPFTIFGFGLGRAGDSVTVTFGGQQATGVVVTDYRSITGLTPPFTLAETYTAETVDVVVTTLGGEVLLVLAYTYLPPRPTPLVQALSPELGPRQGGTPLTITGTNLTGSDGQNPTILVDGNSATNVAVADDGSSVSSLTPPGLIDAPKDVELFTNEGAVAFLSAYTYFAPTITRVSPDVGYEIGSIDDATVEITGTGFGETEPLVKVGGVTVTVTSHSPTSLKIVMPPREPGIYDVEVFPQGDDIGVVQEDGYEYIPTPKGDVDGLMWFDLNKNGEYEEGSDSVFPNLPLTLTLDEYRLPVPERTTPTPSFASFRSTALDERDEPLGTMSQVESSSALTFQLLTDANGRYDFSSLPYGRYTLTYLLPDDVVTTYEPEGSENGVIVIIIEQPEYTANVGSIGQSSLNALVREDNGTLYPNTNVRIRWWGSDRQFNTPDDVIILTITDADSIVDFIQNLPSGRYRVELTTELGDVKISTTLDLLPNATLTGDEFIFLNKRWRLELLDMLPDTGGSIAGLTLSATLLLLGGTAMVVSDRRRRRMASC